MKAKIISILLIITEVIILKVKFETNFQITFLAGFVSILIFMLISGAFNYLQGHGVGIIKNKTFYGLTLPYILVFFLFMGIAIFFLVTGYNLPETLSADAGTYKQISFSLITSLIVLVFYWFLFARAKTYYGSEYELRMKLKQNGDSDEVIENKVQTLKGETIK